MGIRVAIVDDQELVRLGLASMCEGTDISVVGEAANGEAAIEMAQKARADVLIIESRLPVLEGLDAIEMIKSNTPTQKILVLSTFDHPTYLARASALGANDYILKSSSKATILETIRRIHAGEPPPPESIMLRTRGIMTRRRESQDPDMPLTNRELQVLRHVAMGLSNREIGLSLGISIETVKEHVQNILRKIDVADRTQAAVWAVKRSLV